MGRRRPAPVDDGTARPRLGAKAAGVAIIAAVVWFYLSPRRATNSALDACGPECDLQARATWADLNATARAELFIAGAAAGLLAQTLTYPLHVVRRRMQVGGGRGAVLPALWAIYASEGVVNGLFKGLTLTILKGPLQAAIGFTVNDYCRQALRRRGV